jgi:hypothetical protein
MTVDIAAAWRHGVVFCWGQLEGFDPFARGVHRLEASIVACHNHFDHQGTAFPPGIGTGFFYQITPQH